MEIKTAICLSCSKNSLESQLQIQQVRRVCADSRERAVEVHGYALHAGKAVRNEVTHILRCRDSAVDHGERKRTGFAADVRNLSYEPTVHVERHGTCSVYRPTFSIRSAHEVSGVSYIRRVAEAEVLFPHHD